MGIQQAHIDEVYGGYAYTKAPASTAATSPARASNNTVTIEGTGGAKTAYGGYAQAQGSFAAFAEENTLRVDGTADDAYGGCARAYGTGSPATATGNTVILNGTVTGSVYGGYVYSDGGTATASDNTVVLGARLGANALDKADIYGGEAFIIGVLPGGTVSGNTLEVWARGVTVRSIQNFENLYFILPASIKPGDTVLTVSGGAPTIFSGTTNVGVAVAAGARPLNVGDTVTLLANTAGLKNTTGNELVQGADYRKVSLNGKTLKGGQGISLEYDFTLSNTATTLDATVDRFTPPPRPRPHPPTPGGRIKAETKAVVESRAAAAAVLNNAGDLAAFGGIHNALAGFGPQQGQSGMASGDAPGDAIHIILFAAMSGGWQRVESGSHVNISGLAALVGLAGQVQFSGVNVLAGAFFEYGTSSMDTHNSFASGDVDGTGHASYTGGGLLARLDVTESLLRGLYVEGSFRFGGLVSDWHSDDLRDAVTGIRAQYDMYAPYIGAHAGLGYVWQATDSLKVDIYGKYLWTCIYGDDATVALDRFEFDTVDSRRLRVGARLDWQFSESASLYAGAAYEHEFDCTARATTYGFETPAPTVEGDTGVFELGLRWQPTENLKVDLGAVGHVGMRRGIGGNLLVSYTF